MGRAAVDRPLQGRAVGLGEGGLAGHGDVVAVEVEGVGGGVEAVAVAPAQRPVHHHPEPAGGSLTSTPTLASTPIPAHVPAIRSAHESPRTNAPHRR